MPSEALSHRTWTRFPCTPSHLLLVVLAVVVSGPMACASKPQSQALAPTRDALAGLDEFGALLLMAGFPLETIPSGQDVTLEQATGMPDRCVGPVEVRDNGLFAGAFKLDVYYKLDGNGRPERAGSPSTGTW